jgi:hypothetical protein
MKIGNTKPTKNKFVFLFRVSYGYSLFTVLVFGFVSPSLSLYVLFQVSFSFSSFSFPISYSWARFLFPISFVCIPILSYKFFNFGFLAKNFHALVSCPLFLVTCMRLVTHKTLSFTS